MVASGTRRWWALIAIAASVLVVGLDLTVLNLALPTIAGDLHASTGDLQWFASAYSLVLAAAVLPAGLLGDRFGRKRLLIAALILFGVSSAACAYANSAGALIAARAVLGLGAAAIMPLSLAILPVLFAPEERQKAIAIMASATFISFPIGPLVGGWLLDNFWWGSVFLINVPVVVIALIAVVTLMPESRSERRPGVDGAGVVLSSLGLTGLTYGFIKAGQDGWGNATALATIIGGAAVLLSFVAWERLMTRRAAEREAAGGWARQPLVQLSLFRSRGFTWGTILVTMVTFAMFGILFAMPQYFQDVRGVNALGSGVRLLPFIGGMLVGMISGTRLAATRKSADGRPGSPLADVKVLVAAGFVVVAAGLGLAMPTAMNAALGALTAERSGAGSALITAMRQVGATIGVAILGTVLNSAYRGHLDVAGLPATAAGAARASVSAGVQMAHTLGSPALLGSVRVAFVHGMDIMLWACGGIALTSALLALAFLPRRAAASAAGAATMTGTSEAGVTVAQQAESGR